MMRQRPLIWLLALFVVTFVSSTAIANVGVKQNGETTPAMMAEESSFATANSTPVMTSSETDGMAAECGFDAANIGIQDLDQPMTIKAADEDGAQIGTMVQPIDGEMKKAAAAVSDETTKAAAHTANLNPATNTPNMTQFIVWKINTAVATTEKNPVDTASDSTAAVDVDTTNAAQYVTTRSTMNRANPQDAATANTQSEVWVPNDIAGADITPATWTEALS